MLEKIKKNRRKIERYAIATAAGIAAVVIVKQSEVIKDHKAMLTWMGDSLADGDKASLEYIKSVVIASRG